MSLTNTPSKIDYIFARAAQSYRDKHPDLTNIAVAFNIDSIEKSLQPAEAKTYAQTQKNSFTRITDILFIIGSISVLASIQAHTCPERVSLLWANNNSSGYVKECHIGLSAMNVQRDFNNELERTSPIAALYTKVKLYCGVSLPTELDSSTHDSLCVEGLTYGILR